MNESPASPLEYGRERPRRLRRVWRIVRRLILFATPLLAYVVLYLCFARRDVYFGGGYAITYPGAVRFYALSDKMAQSLGRSDESTEKARQWGITVRRFDESVYQANQKWYSGLWRGFYPLERLEIWARGGEVMPIRYSGVALDRKSAADPATLPFTGLVYHEWFVRDGRLYRFVAAEYGGRNAGHELKMRTDIYLFEWDLKTPFESSPRPAAPVRIVDSTTRIKWADRWLVDADRYLTWDSQTGSVSSLAHRGEGQPASVLASLQDVGPVRCSTYSPITVSRSGRYFAAERNGLSIFDSRTLAPVHQIKESPSLAKFFAARKDELSNTNSHSFLSDDAKFLVRIVDAFKSKNDEFIYGTSAVVYDIKSDSTRDISLNLGARSDVKDVERVDGAWQFYLQSTPDGKSWPHHIVDEKLRPIVEVGPPSAHSGLERLGWDPGSALLVELPGFTSSPQPLDQDSEIMVQDARTGKKTIGVIRYGDAKGFPGLFRKGVMKLNPF